MRTSEKPREDKSNEERVPGAFVVALAAHFGSEPVLAFPGGVIDIDEGAR